MRKGGPMKDRKKELKKHGHKLEKYDEQLNTNSPLPNEPS